MAASFGLSDVFSRTFTANEALSKHDAVVLLSSGNVEAADGAGDLVLGFASRDAASGEEVSVRLLGAPSNNAVANGSINVGAEVFPSTTAGRVSATGTPGTHPVLGVALTASSGNGDTIVIARAATV